MTTASKKFLESFNYSLKKIDTNKIEKLISKIKALKKRKGRIFFLGVGGSAGNTSHAVNDFRKLCNIECYAPTDNVSELTARTNDEGFNTIFVEYLKISKLSKNDAIFIFSVGGGNKKKKVSTNLIEAIVLAKKRGANIFSIVGRQDGYSYKHSDISILVKVNNKKLLTPISEAMQPTIWHLIVSDKRLQSQKTKW